MIVKTTVGDLEEVRAEKGQIAEQESCRDRARQRHAPVQFVARYDVGQDRRDDHRRADRDAVRAGQIRGAAEADDQRDRRQHQRPVHVRHVDLADLGARRVDDLHARQIAELNGLPR